MKLIRRVFFSVIKDKRSLREIERYSGEIGWIMVGWMPDDQQLLAGATRSSGACSPAAAMTRKHNVQNGHSGQTIQSY